MTTIKITAAELLPGDNVDGDIIATVDVQGPKTYITYQDDDTRMRVASSDIRCVERVNGVSTVGEDAPAAVERPNWLAIEVAAGAERERQFRNDLRRDNYRLYGR